jgi:tetratricopeptide (TPR) repeat protein
MRWLQTEYVLKGIYLGLLLFLALRVPDWPTAGLVAACTLGGLVLALSIAAVGKRAQGFRVRGRVLPFLLFLLLESPTLVYAGVLAGTAAGALFLVPVAEGQDQRELFLFVGGGALVGVAFGALRQVKEKTTRFGLSLALAAALVAGVLVLFGEIKDLGLQWSLPLPKSATLFGVQVLFGIAIFYLLTFAGREEESEVEIGAMCAALGLGIWMVWPDAHELPALQPVRSAGFLIPIAIYVIYTARVLPGLRVFKHSLRGLSYLQLGKFRLALLSLRRALQLAPRNRLARETLWNVHRRIDYSQLPNDPDLLALIDLDLCLDRAGALLVEPSPTTARLEEAGRLLNLVLSQRPALGPRVQYWKAVAHTHARQYDRAAAELTQVLDHSVYAANDPQRQAVLLQAWQLALTLHDELRKRVGQPQIALPGRRMEAIAAVERHLATHPDDRSIWPLKQLLYQDVTEADYNVATGGGDLVLPHFDHAYAQQLGLALINDPVRWQRGGEYLRLAARGLPATGPTMFIQIAQANQRAGNEEGARHNFEMAKRAGRLVGPKNLADEERLAYFQTVKQLGEAALARGDLDAAIENYLLLTEWERSGVETLRLLADLYERRGDPLAAVRVTEQALVYNGRDKDLLERKDRYYYSVLPDDLRARKDAVGGSFDVGYCLRKARSLLETRNADLDLLDWAQHLVELVRVVQPENVTARLLLARLKLRRGESADAVTLLEGMRNPTPETFASADEQEAWYVGSRMLGDLYLQELGKPELAIACYNDFRKCSKSGADTMYKLGQAYEQLGDRAKAKRFYEQVTAYEQHPLAPEARSALYRLQAN